MGRWRIPEKILLPAEPDRTGTFAFNGRLPSGDQVMAYLGSRSGETYPATTPYVRFTAVLFRFDPDGVLRECAFDSTTHGGDYLEKDSKQSYQKAREILLGLFRGVEAEGWVSADILVRPFHVNVDGFVTGLIYRTSGDDESADEEEDEYSEEEVRLVPFDKIFRRPWTDGCYST